jgi:hypothetical protein
VPALASQIFPFLIAAVIGGLVLYITLFCTYEWAITFLLRRYGVTTEAKVTKYRGESGRTLRLYITYTFKVKKPFDKERQRIPVGRIESDQTNNSKQQE